MANYILCFSFRQISFYRKSCFLRRQGKETEEDISLSNPGMQPVSNFEVKIMKLMEIAIFRKTYGKFIRKLQIILQKNFYRPSRFSIFSPFGIFL